jgi:hypothetical protein
MSDIHTDETLDGIEPGAALSVSDEKLENGLSWVSKSRIKTYKKCPFNFFLKYWCEHRPPGTYYTEKGSQIHEAFEIFHENLIDHIEAEGQIPERFTPLMPDGFGLTSQWLDFIGSFWEFELRRWEEAERTLNYAFARLPGGAVNFHEEMLNAWEPLEVEAEFWMGQPPEDYDGEPDYVDESGPPVGDIPWMGKADVVLNSASVPGVTGSGVTIVDYKTGSCPKVKYEGAPFLDEVMEETFLETEYYGWMAEHVYDVDAVAIYYPDADELVVGEYGVQERRWDIKDAALGLQERPGERDEDGVPENFDFEPQNLCYWENDNGTGACHFYNICPSAQGQ